MTWYESRRNNAAAITTTLVSLIGKTVTSIAINEQDANFHGDPYLFAIGFADGSSLKIERNDENAIDVEVTTVLCSQCAVLEAEDEENQE
jgi:hypothetical protein